MDDKLKTTIVNHYQKGEGSIQDIARVYRLSVEEVLDVLGLSDVATIEGAGDLIDQTEAGPEVVLKEKNVYKPRFTLN